MTEEQLMAMPCCAIFRIPRTNMDILRVPGGWLYTNYDSLHRTPQTATFVTDAIYEEGDNRSKYDD